MIKLYPSVSAPARIYGTPKMHKFSSDSFPKLRPIVSSTGTFNYNLARFLLDLLSPLVPNDYFCKDTFSFVSQIKNANLSKKFLVSYNVTSLFTNISLQGTIDIAINLIFNHNPNLNMTKNELKKTFYGIIGVHSPPPSKILALPLNLGPSLIPKLQVPP